MVRQVDYKPKPIDPEFLNKPDEYPQNGEYMGIKIYAQGIQRYDEEGKPYPTKLGIYGTIVAVDFEACIADGVCMDVCPVNVFEWLLNPGKAGTGNDKIIDPNKPEDKELWEKYRTDKAFPIRENNCIFCMACELGCPTKAIKINQPA